MGKDFPVNVFTVCFELIFEKSGTGGPVKQQIKAEWPESIFTNIKCFYDS